MKQIGFHEFFIRASKLVPSEILPDLNPYCMYFEFNGALIGIEKLDKEIMWIEIVAGKGLHWARELIYIAKKAGFKKLRFATTEKNKPINALARYCNAKKTEHYRKYPDGSKTVYFEIPLFGGRF